jgi:membrane protease YdiL (CAAX protease family)
MKQLSLSVKIFFVLDVILAILTGIYVLLGQYPALPGQTLPAPLPVLAAINAVAVFLLYGGLGLVGLILARRLGLPGICDEKVTNRKRFVLPAMAGVAIGILFILSDLVLRNFNTVGAIPHPAFPSSLIASATAGIGEEMIFRLFLISLLTWLVSGKILKGRWQAPVFWAASAISALVFGLGHLPALMILFGISSFQVIPAVFLAEVLVLNGVLSLVSAYFFKKSEFLAAVGVHFWTDIVWHVIFGLL